MRIFNSLTRSVEEFKPLKPGRVGMYTCGPTVYDYDHIGHGWKYVHDDLLRRVLTYEGYGVIHVQNITDVGHLVSDADEGEDKLEKGAKKRGKTVWEAADFFMQAHFASMDKLNVLRPTVVCRATDHIAEQVALVQRLVNKGYAYDTDEAVYFAVSKFPRYNGLFGNQGDEGRRVAGREGVQTGEHKRAGADFALWFKRVGRFANHQMHWASPWGDGFPGWHIECSAMAMKYLGETLDIHTGGIDHLAIHHPNEIAQSEAATAMPFARYWVHYSHVLVDGVKMSKSAGNYYRVEDVVERGFGVMALRYLFLTAHYRTSLNFTWSGMASAQSAYDRLCEFVRGSRVQDLGFRRELAKEKLKKLESYGQRFREAVSDDLGTPQALAVVWEMMKSNIPDWDKLDALLDWDQVLGLRLAEVQAGEEVPEGVRELAAGREKLRLEGKFVAADGVRMEIEKMGWTVEDTKTGPKFRRLFKTPHA